MKLLYVQLALGLFQLDHAVKQEIEQLPEQEEEHLLPGGLAGIKRLHNYGTAGGHARGHMDKIIRWSGCVTAGIAAMFAWVLTKPDRKMEKTGYTFLLGGALSNLYDRCRKGYVTDYIRFETAFVIGVRHKFRHDHSKIFSAAVFELVNEFYHVVFVNERRSGEFERTRLVLAIFAKMRHVFHCSAATFAVAYVIRRFAPFANAITRRRG